MRIFSILLFVAIANTLSAQDFAVFYDFNQKLYQLEHIETGELLPQTYEELYFSDDKYFIKINGKYGLLDASGNIILEPVYTKLNKSGGYLFALKDYKIMTIYNRDFEIIKKAEYLSAYKNNGLIYVKNIRTKKNGVLDSLGNTIIPEEYDYIIDYSRYNKERFVCIKKGKHGVVDKNNKIIIPFEYNSISLLNNENNNPLRLDIIEPNNLYFVLKNTSGFEMKIGVIDFNGKIIIPLDYSNGYSIFNDGLISLEKNRKFGYVNRDNEVKIPFMYDAALPFYYGVASVENNKKYGVINVNNQIVVPFDNYRNHFVFSNGLAKFSLNYGKFGMINTKGEVVVSQIYDDIVYVVNSKFYRTFKDGKQGVIDINGKEIIPAKYSFVQTLFKDEENDKTYFFVGIDGKNGVVDEKDTVILDLKYRYIGKRYNLITISENDKQGLLDLDFNVIVAPKYLKMKVNNTNWISVGDKDGNIFNIDSTGKRTTKKLP